MHQEPKNAAPKPHTIAEVRAAALVLSRHVRPLDTTEDADYRGYCPAEAATASAEDAEYARYYPTN